MSEFPFDVTDDTFEAFISINGMPIIIEFWDPWCSICEEMAPIYANLAKKYEGKMKFGKLNMRENPLLPEKFQVYVTPSFVFFKDCKEVHRAGGLIEPSSLEEELRKFV